MNYWLRLLVLWLVVGASLRAVLLWYFSADAVTPQLPAFLAGLVNDLQSYFLAAGLVALFGVFKQAGLRFGAFLLLALALLLVFAELFFWFEFESRLDRLVFHYLAYPKEVAVFLDEQFHVTLYAIPFLLFVWVLDRWIGHPQVERHSTWLHSGLVVCGIAVIFFGQPLGQSNSRLASEFASNGYLGVLVAARYAEDSIAWLEDPEFVYPVPTEPVSSALLDEIRGELTGIRHVVFIIEESFSGPVYENDALRAQYLPNFSALAKDSVSFSNNYATGSRTTRGLEALLNGFPPLPGISTTERRRFSRLPSLARAFAGDGYQPVFLYGGWPGFSNFSNYWQAMGFETIWTRNDFDEDFETSWGVADGALFERLLKEMTTLTNNNEHVFLATLTVSHHRPFDFPTGSVDYPPSARRSEYAMAYADQALGDFFAAAREQPWFEETLFVVSADHGLHPRGDALIPASSYRIPLLFHAAGMQPREINQLGSSISVPKTLLSMLQIQSEEAFAGDNLLCDCDTIVPVEAGYHIGLLERGGLHVLRSDGQYVRWPFDANSNRVGSASDVSKVDAGQRIIDYFSPAYAWYYAD